MNDECMAKLAEQWGKICQHYSVNDHIKAQNFIQQHSFVLVNEFYRNIVLEPEAADFFKDDIIQQRLKNSLNQWLIESFDVALNQAYFTAVEKQQKVGQVHARVGIPSWLIMRGIHEIEIKILQLLDELQLKNSHQMLSYMLQIMGFATEIMCRSYEANTEQNHEVKHSYRLFSAMQDVAVQKDKQRSILLDWENELMFKVFSEHPQLQHIALSKSEFGLWFVHKAAYAFTGAEQVETIIGLIQQVDALNLHVLDCQDQTQKIERIQDIREMNRQIQHLVDQLFQVTEYIDSGNDSLTQLLNRRYLSTIVSREINFARRNDAPLSLLAIDADYFKGINDKYGHTAGDLALRFIAEALLDVAKGSDYAFRVGGEEFLLLLVDSNLQRASDVAETIRSRIQETSIRTPLGQSFSFTVSIGCTIYNGHPDYQRFLDTADAALYTAKNNGRNCIHVSEKLLSV